MRLPRRLALRSGLRMPRFGLGTWQAQGGDCYQAVLEALKASAGRGRAKKDFAARGTAWNRVEPCWRERQRMRSEMTPMNHALWFVFVEVAPNSGLGWRLGDLDQVLEGRTTKPPIQTTNPNNQSKPPIQTTN